MSKRYKSIIFKFVLILSLGLAPTVEGAIELTDDQYTYLTEGEALVLDYVDQQINWNQYSEQVHYPISVFEEEFWTLYSSSLLEFRDLFLQQISFTNDYWNAPEPKPTKNTFFANQSQVWQGQQQEVPFGSFEEFDEFLQELPTSTDASNQLAMVPANLQQAYTVYKDDLYKQKVRDLWTLQYLQSCDVIDLTIPTILTKIVSDDASVDGSPVAMARLIQIGELARIRRLIFIPAILNSNTSIPTATATILATEHANDMTATSEFGVKADALENAWGCVPGAPTTSP